ncbi:LysR family transcriptional regulator [Diaphorobacter ruginosibacter]|uniref:LysR family transcriptional regulator n=1 Tax=Diaphorobacter ruginosibacter TaxID=1715720 RepID=A0A7G9RM38_9BURK|nr:LysR family transcriptional regulator [Diaphorobacter ruginosibacter]QNN56663.1 LysR family transcriptional regulator [Diaphorobacter ruginosibacter]
MQNTDWDDLRVFLAVAREGALSAAARALGVNHSTVLRRLGALESRMDVRLFDRLPTGYAMTLAGESLRDRLRGVEEQIDTAQRQLSGLDLRLSGTIRITTTDTLLIGLLGPMLAEFRALHPGIQLQLVVNNSFLSLNKREADVAIRPSNTPPDYLIGRRAGRVQTAIYASKAYLKARPRHRKLAELDWVALDEGLSHLAQARWLRTHIPMERIVAQVDSLNGMTQLVRAGMGTGLLLCMLADGDRQLVQIEPPSEDLDTQVWVLTHPDLKDVARIKAFTDFIHARLAAHEMVLGTPRRVERGSAPRP